MGLFSFFNKKKIIPAAPTFFEKRVLPRWKISAPAKIKWEGFKDYMGCEIRDLNLKGFCLVLNEKIPEPNAAAELYFNEKYFFDIEISIIWHKEVEAKQIYGVKFVRVRDVDKEKIYQMMKDNFAGCFGKLI